MGKRTAMVIEPPPWQIDLVVGVRSLAHIS